MLGQIIDLRLDRQENTEVDHAERPRRRARHMAAPGAGDPPPRAPG